MSFYTLFRALAAFLLLSGVAAAAHAQSVCVGPYLGDGGVEESCVHVNETGVGGVSMDFRGPSPRDGSRLSRDRNLDFEVGPTVLIQGRLGAPDFVL